MRWPALAHITDMAVMPRISSPFRSGSVDLGRCLLGNVDNIAEVLAVAERESFR